MWCALLSAICYAIDSCLRRFLLACGPFSYKSAWGIGLCTGIVQCTKKSGIAQEVRQFAEK
jgi:hypothetical protein